MRVVRLLAEQRAAAVAAGRGPASRRALLRLNVRNGDILREWFPPGEAGPALAHALSVADRAAAALAAIPDTAELQGADAGVLAAGADGAAGEEVLQKLGRLVQGYLDGNPFDRVNAAPVQVLAYCLARAAASGEAGTEATAPQTLDTRGPGLR